MRSHQHFKKRLSDGKYQMSLLETARLWELISRIGTGSRWEWAKVQGFLLVTPKMYGSPKNHEACLSGHIYIKALADRHTQHEHAKGRRWRAIVLGIGARLWVKYRILKLHSYRFLLALLSVLLIVFLFFFLLTIRLNNPNCSCSSLCLLVWNIVVCESGLTVIKQHAQCLQYPHLHDTQVHSSALVISSRLEVFIENQRPLGVQGLVIRRLQE